MTTLSALPLLHRDPFDRILIAQAMAEGLDFITNDEPISEYLPRDSRDPFCSEDHKSDIRSGRINVCPPGSCDRPIRIYEKNRDFR